MLLHEWIRQQRERGGLDQEDVADALGLSQSYVSRIEGGKVRITVHLLQRLAEAIGFKPEDAVKLSVQQAA